MGTRDELPPSAAHTVGVPAMPGGPGPTDLTLDVPRDTVEFLARLLAVHQRRLRTP